MVKKMNYLNVKEIDGKIFETLVKAGASNLNKNVTIVNDLNVFPIPDGDTGINMFRTINGGIEEMVKVSSSLLKDKAKALSRGMLINARGNSGVILSQLFSGLAKVLKNYDTANISVLSQALLEAVNTAYQAVKKPVEGTILTVARESYNAVSLEINEDTTLSILSTKIIEYMRKSLENTPNLLPVLKEAGVIDSGGAGLLFIHEGIDEAIRGGDIEDNLTISSTSADDDIDFSKFNEESVINFGYCTEILLQLQKSKCDPKTFDVNTLISYFESIGGDSIVAFKTDSVVKVHVHTKTPQKVLDFAQKYGEFLKIKIENMDLQHSEVIAKKEEKALPKVKRARKKYGILAVATGDGIKSALKEFGCDIIIDGGAGANVSTKDFLNAFEEINADNIFILPDDSNLVMAAELAKGYYPESKIFVLRSKNLGEVYTAISSADLENDNPEAIYESINEAIAESNTLMISKSIRDTNLNGVDIKKNDYIGFDNDKIMASCPTKLETFKKLAEINHFEDVELLTLFYGKDMTSSEKKEIKEFVNNTYKRIELYELDGNQDSYDIVLIIE